MPKLSKRTLSLYIKSDCERRFALDLFNHDTKDSAKRIALGMPARQPTRPGFDQVARAGDEWQFEKVQDLQRAFGKSKIIWKPAPTAKQPWNIDHQDLLGVLTSAPTHSFLVESQFAFAPAFKAQFGLDALERGKHKLRFARLRPDLIYVGSHETDVDEICVTGEIIPRPPGDSRIGLRVLDIKLTSEPSAAYFAETVLYSIGLAGWLIETGLSAKYFVRADPSVWPGSYEASPLLKAEDQARRAGRVASIQELLDGLEAEIEIAPADVFTPRLRNILEQTLPHILDSSTSWDALPWDVTARCRNCDYLGMHWGAAKEPDPGLCIPKAKSVDHLSRVAFVPRGAYRKLRANDIAQVSHLGKSADGHPAFESHPQLRAHRGIVKGRASSLACGMSGIANASATSAVLPAWPKARIFLVAEFDPSSAISVAFALTATWWEVDANFENKQQRKVERFMVNDRSINTERDVFIQFLTAIADAITGIKKTLGDVGLQIYVWDSVTFDHLTRLIGRHLDTLLFSKDLKKLAWLFPPNQLIANADLLHKGSVVAIVNDVVRSSLAAPIPHVYTLLSVARHYHLSFVTDANSMFAIDEFYEDPLTSQVPIERIHEFWHPATRAKHIASISAKWDHVLRVKLRALEHIVTRFTLDLRDSLVANPPKISSIKAPTARENMAADSQLVYAFAQYNDALSAQESLRIRSLRAVEREATFASALLDGLYADAQTVLTQFNLTTEKWRYVFSLSKNSSEVKAKAGDFLFAISDPDVLWFLDQKLGYLTKKLCAEPPEQLIPKWARNSWKNIPLYTVLRVTVRAIDRANRAIAVDFDQAWWPLISWLQTKGVISFSSPLMIDPLHKDYFLDKLEKTLKAIGISPAALSATMSSPPPLGGNRGAFVATRYTDNAVAEVLWKAKELEKETLPDRPPSSFPEVIISRLELNAEQLLAVQHAYSKRMTLIWGPPGTGKTHTLAAAIVALFSGTASGARKIRMLVCAQTYAAIDEVLRKVSKFFLSGQPLHGLNVIRLHSSSVEPAAIAHVRDVTLKHARTYQPTQDALEIVEYLRNSTQPTLVFGPPQQIYTLSEFADDKLQTELFDVVMLDEAGQLDFGNGALALHCLAENGSAIIAGDPLQLPPIRQSVAPEAYENLLGSLYSYFKHRQEVPECSLVTSYRSNSVIVEAVAKAGYPRLSAHSPHLKIRSRQNFDDVWDAILVPNEPCCTIIYDDGEHAQANPTEVQIIAKIAERARLNISNALINEKGNHSTDPDAATAFDEDVFWKEGIGIVTPHRAQQAMIIAELTKIFPTSSPLLIRDAVDTVERFQGQQRNIILVSFALGDTDAIATEEEFLLSLNRFNVMISRARAKVVVVVSRQVLDHLSDDIEILNQSRLLKWYSERYCNVSTPISLPIGSSLDAELRTRSFAP
ncbi:AAA domain-containing protein [Janthinobacterium sp. LB2P10]|uniref:bifunctional RecB family nuclease/DEAD/DEAH box helicase n=1 Tax=Janthinobacterium sp. LB2P10 TaxID=3424194 RepID=UPI003F231538